MHSTVYFFKTHPFVRLLIGLTIGIIYQYYYPLQFNGIVFGLLAALLSSFAFSLLSAGKHFKLHSLQGIALILSIAFGGALLIHANDISNRKVDITDSSTSNLYVQLKEDPIAKPNSYKANAEIIAAKEKTWTAQNATIIIYFEKNSSLQKSLHLGDQLIIPHKLQRIKNSGNPGAFDYASYCKRMGILHQTYVREKEVKIAAKNNSTLFERFFYSVRKHILYVIRKNVPDKNSAAIAEALLIGYKIDLDKDLIQAYSNTGVIHIIAISGLHLALIYALLLKLVNLIPAVKRRKLKWAIVLCFLWGFSILAGSSPSVLRAAVMFSFIILGHIIQKEPRPLNNLAASAFCLLVYDPYYFWDAGFQLSYAAVASIMVFYKPIYNIFYIKNKLLDGLWKLNAITIAAQILTLPIVIYHFHQFPNVFLFSNLIAVPLSSIVLYTELLLLVFSPIGTIATFFGGIVSFLISTLNNFIRYMNSFAYATTDQMHMSFTMMVILFVFILLLSHSLLNYSKKHLLFSMVALLVLCSLNTINSYQTSVQSKLIVYNINKTAAAEVLIGSKAYFIGEPRVIKEPQLYNFHIKPTHTTFNISNISGVLPAMFKVGAIQIAKGNKFPIKMPDVFIISGDPKLNNIQMTPSACILVADNTNARWKINQWKKQADSLHLRFHSIPDDGAFVMDL
jgi:competence protein ComEC